MARLKTKHGSRRQERAGQTGREVHLISSPAVSERL